MDLQEFEQKTRDNLHHALDQLQTATLLLSALELHLLESGNTVKQLSRTIETYITSQRDQTEVTQNS
jgi:hypothetical protein